MNIVNRLKILKSLLNKSNFNLDDIYKQIDLIYKYKEITSYEYLNNLLYPEKYKGAKIPSNVPLPTSTFQLRNQFKLKTNNKGNFVLCMNPFFLAGESLLEKTYTPTYPAREGEAIDSYKVLSVSNLWYNNSYNMDGIIPDKNWIPYDIGQMVPDVYCKYRLVSGVISMKYVGPLDEVQGTVGGSVLLTDEKYFATKYKIVDFDAFNFDSVNTSLADYTMFNYLRNGLYNKENTSIEGVRMLYFPVDNSYEEFKELCVGKNVDIEYTHVISQYRPIFSSNQYKTGFNWFLYAYNCEPQAEHFQIEYTLNFECIPSSKYINYIPTNTSSFNMTPKEKRDVLEEVKKNIIQKLNN